MLDRMLDRVLDLTPLCEDLLRPEPFPLSWFRWLVPPDPDCHAVL